MNFYIIQRKRTPNSWNENEIIEYELDMNRDRNDPLYPKIDFNHPPFCPKCGKRLKIYHLPPLRREIHVAKPYFGDFVFDSEIYCSERFKTLYEQSGLKGIEQFRKIEILRVVTHNGVRKAKLPPVPTYYLADITVDGAIMDYKRSKAVFCPPIYPRCDYCDNTLEKGKYCGLLDKCSGVYVDETRWNNNNIFELLGGLSLFVVDQRFKDWFDAQHFNNASLFIPDSEKSINNGNYDSRVKEYGQEGLRYDLD